MTTLLQALRHPLRALLLVVGLCPLPALALSFLPFEQVRPFYSTVEFDGSQRTVGYLRPANPQPNPPAIIVLHFNIGTAASMANLTEIAELVRDEGTWVILPEAPGLTWAHTPADGDEDVNYLVAVIDDAVARYGIDASRIYMTGYSQGANMTVRMACDRPDKIAAGAIVAATMRKALERVCAPSQPTPMAFFNGTEDDQVPYNGGLLSVALSAPDAAAYWANVNGCPATPTRTALPDAVTDQTTVVLDRYEGCSSGGAVAFYTVQGGGHNWPGALDFIPRVGLTTQDIRANREMWEFFKRFSR